MSLIESICKNIYPLDTRFMEQAQARQEYTVCNEIPYNWNLHIYNFHNCTVISIQRREAIKDC